MNGRVLSMLTAARASGSSDLGARRLLQWPYCSTVCTRQAPASSGTDYSTGMLGNILGGNPSPMFVLPWSHDLPKPQSLLRLTALHLWRVELSGWIY